MAGWRLMSGIDWAAMDTVAAMVGVEDPEAWIVGLTTIRDWYLRKAADANQREDDGPDQLCGP